MAEIGGGIPVMGGRDNQDPCVADLMQKLNLTAQEGAVVDFSDDEDVGVEDMAESALVGKVLSPSVLHVTTIRGAMKPAWGNPFGLKIRSIGEKANNMFVAEFGSKVDMDHVLAGSPWMVGRHAVILQRYDEWLSASDICFDRMEIWARILNLPLGWMNRDRGSRAMGLLGVVVRVDVDADGKVSGAFLHARVAIEIDKPIRQGVLLRMSRSEEPRWFQAQYEKLPYHCFSCGVVGHSELECATPMPRNASGKLPYDVQLQALEERRKRP
ncbi:hypothetical protein QOZ80_8AG0620680 [Eleusine coracana subsp. coracana]|nr:hypothetical protein QOZ80_8AG0620680 [Eleusine coracana subsp. coracana]